MNEFVDTLNQNQGVLAAVAILLTMLGGVVAWLFKKDKKSSHFNSPYINAGRAISAGGDIIVGGSKTSVRNETFPTVIIKPDGFTHNTGRLDLIFENTGNSTANIQKLIIGNDNASIDEFTLSPNQKITKQLNVGGFSILEQRLATPNLELSYKDFSNNKNYKTVANIDQESRADGKFNLGKITDQTFIQPNTQDQMTEEEEEILRAMQAELGRDNEGNAYLLRVDRLPSFVKVGNEVFGKEENPMEMKKYGEALLRLKEKGFVERKSEKRFVLTVKGGKNLNRQKV